MKLNVQERESGKPLMSHLDQCLHCVILLFMVFLFCCRSWHGSFQTAVLLSIFAGFLGVDRFYLGHVTMGIVKLTSFGGFGVLWFLDIILIIFGSLQPIDGLGWN